MDSIPWEKAQLAAEEKPHCVLEKKTIRTEILKNIALCAGLASPNQLRHGSAQASLALLIWLKRWIGKEEKD